MQEAQASQVPPEGLQEEEIAPQSYRRHYLKKRTGVLQRQSAAVSKRYVPKGGFIKVYEEISGPLDRHRLNSSSARTTPIKPGPG